MAEERGNSPTLIYSTQYAADSWSSNLCQLTMDLIRLDAPDCHSVAALKCRNGMDPAAVQLQGDEVLYMVATAI